jgi:uncharacterized protein (TIGR02246 family)
MEPPIRPQIASLIGKDNQMRTQFIPLLVLAACAVILSARPALAQAESNPQEAAIFKSAEAFVDAFHKGDAKAVAAFWTADGDYVDQTGKHLKGRQAIEEAFHNFFSENKGMKLRINVTSLRFVTPELAIEDGTTETLPPNGAPPSRTRYTNVHVKKGGQWSLASVRESAYAPPSNYEQLRGLEWAIGEWVEDADKSELSSVSLDWTPDQNFIVSQHGVAFNDISLGHGTQWIAWDPAAKRIRSWTFESNGSFSEGSWAEEGGKWVINTNTVLRDGKKLAATNIVTRVDADNIRWQSKDRTLDGKPLPDTQEIKMKRGK